jgi:hypothetical protein
LIANGPTIALFALSAGIAFAASTTPDSTTSADPVVVAQAAVVTPAPMVVQTYPAYEAGAVAAAKEGPEALRRYLWRTRMIYNFYYPDFVRFMAAT